MIFVYQAFDGAGRRKEGRVDAADRARASADLARSGLRVFSLEPLADAKKKAREQTKEPPPRGRSAAHSPGSAPSQKRLRRADLEAFAGRLSELLDAGMPLEGALGALAERSRAGRIAGVAADLRRRVQEGESFSGALKNSDAGFSPLFCGMSAAGEAAGALAPALRRQAEHLRAMGELRAKTLGAMIYPAALLIAGLGVAALFAGYLVPRLTILVESTGARLPAGASLLIAASDFIRVWWWALLIALVIAALALRLWLRSPAGRETAERALMRAPLFGSMAREALAARYARALADLLGGGMPLARAMELACAAAGGARSRAGLETAAARVAEGWPPSRALEAADIFPEDFLDVVGVGEQSGKMARAMNSAAAAHERSLEERARRAGELVQPAVIAMMALIVGSMAYLMLGVIFDVIGSLRETR